MSAPHRVVRPGATDLVPAQELIEQLKLLFEPRDALSRRPARQPEDVGLCRLISGTDANPDPVRPGT
ncbi:MAG TPA: hypothetical protein VMO26_06830 [Vicinamibacterales bacterium]|nr:hypothetical protein [Vicinamibacterales bacterium]